MSYARFPLRTLRGDRTVYRIHQAAFSPWWFSEDGSGRFDPVGTGHGACYVADSELGAWVEVFRRQMAWVEGDVDRRRILSVKLGRDLKLADITSRRALQFGVTAQLGAGSDLAQSQAVAAAVLADGFDGIRYLVRHDPAQNLVGYAIFDEAGQSTNWPAVPSGPLSTDLRADAARLYGYRILPRP